MELGFVGCILVVKKVWSWFYSNIHGLSLVPYVYGHSSFANTNVGSLPGVHPSTAFASYVHGSATAWLSFSDFHMYSNTLPNIDMGALGLSFSCINVDTTLSYYNRGALILCEICKLEKFIDSFWHF
ncbi:hypothetical protein ACFX19_023052 [Malus domestica]